MKKIVSMAVLGVSLFCLVKPVYANEWKEQVPVPVFDEEPGLVELYWKAWELAHDSILEKPGLPQTPYMWPGAWKHSIWIWDTCFMSLYCRYAPDVFPGVESLNNFYVPLHDGWDGLYPMNIQHPDNPPLFAWVEYDYYKFTGDDAHIRKLLNEKQYLQKHFEWFNSQEPGWRFKSDTTKKVSAPVRIKKTENGYLWNRYPSGMDNTPRGRGVENEILWVDAIAQQGLAALYISRMAEAIGDMKLAAEWKAKYDEIKKKVNELYWNEEDGIYYDIDSVTLEHSKVKTPASYWPMFAEMCSRDQAKRMLANALDENTFGGIRPWPTVARDDPVFKESEPDGQYWRGAVWPPLAYMATKALEKYGFHEEADEIAHNVITHFYRTYRDVEPHTIWECFSATRDYPGTTVKRNKAPRRVRLYVGWSSLPPISLFIENVIGFHTIDAQRKRVEWRLHSKGRHGIQNLRFGDVVTDILTDGKGAVSVTSNKPYTLVVNGAVHEITAGESDFRIADVK